MKLDDVDETGSEDGQGEGRAGKMAGFWLGGGKLNRVSGLSFAVCVMVRLGCGLGAGEERLRRWWWSDQLIQLLLGKGEGAGAAGATGVPTQGRRGGQISRRQYQCQSGPWGVSTLFFAGHVRFETSMCQPIQLAL